MMEGIEYCVDQVDEHVMAELLPRITSIIRKGVGLPTKAGTARFIVTLCIKKRSYFQPHADVVLKALSGAVQDRNASVRKSCATAVGYTCQLATDGKVIAFVNHLKKLCVENEGRHIFLFVTAVGSVYLFLSGGLLQTKTPVPSAGSL